MADQSVWHLVADVSNPQPEPFMVLRVDTRVLREGGVEGKVISLHSDRAEAELQAERLDRGLSS